MVTGFGYRRDSVLGVFIRFDLSHLRSRLGIFLRGFFQHKRFEPTDCDTHQRIQHHQSNQRQVQGRLGALRRFGPDRVLYPGKSDLRACHYRVGHPSTCQNTKTIELTILALIRGNSTKGSIKVDPFNVTECVHAAVKSVHLVCFLPIE